MILSLFTHETFPYISSERELLFVHLYNLKFTKTLVQARASGLLVSIFFLWWQINTNFSVVNVSILSTNCKVFV